MQDREAQVEENQVRAAVSEAVRVRRERPVCVGDLYNLDGWVG